MSFSWSAQSLRALQPGYFQREGNPQPWGHIIAEAECVERLQDFSGYESYNALYQVMDCGEHIHYFLVEESDE